MGLEPFTCQVLLRQANPGTALGSQASAPPNKRKMRLHHGRVSFLRTITVTVIGRVRSRRTCFCLRFYVSDFMPRHLPDWEAHVLDRRRLELMERATISHAELQYKCRKHVFGDTTIREEDIWSLQYGSKSLWNCFLIRCISLA